MTNSGYGSQTHHHLLIDNQYRDQDKQRPEQASAIVLTGLSIGSNAPGVVISDHRHKTGSHDDEQCKQACKPRFARCCITNTDCAPGTLNVSNVGLVEVCGAHLILAGDEGGIFFNHGHRSTPLLLLYS